MFGGKSSWSSLCVLYLSSLCSCSAEDSGGNIFGGGLRQNFSFRPLFPTSTNFIREKTGTAAGSQKFADLFWGEKDNLCFMLEKGVFVSFYSIWKYVPICQNKFRSKKSLWLQWRDIIIIITNIWSNIHQTLSVKLCLSFRLIFDSDSLLLFNPKILIRTDIQNHVMTAVMTVHKWTSCQFLTPKCRYFATKSNDLSFQMAGFS